MATQEGVTDTPKTVDEVRSGALMQFTELFSGEAAPPGKTEETESVDTDQVVLSQNDQVPEEPPAEPDPTEEPEQPAEEPAEEPTPEEEAPPTEPAEEPPVEEDQTQAKIQRRIDRITAREAEKREALQAKIDDLESRLSQSPDAPPTQSDPLESIKTPEELGEYKKQALTAVKTSKQLLTYLENAPQQVEAYMKQNGVSCNAEIDGSYTVEAMRESLTDIKDNAQTILTVIPEKKYYFDHISAAEEKAYAQLPGLKDEDSDEREVYDKLVKKFPQAKSNPDWPELLMYATKGKMGTLTASTKVPPRPTRTSGRPKSTPGTVRSTAVDKTKRAADWSKIVSGDKSARMDLISGLIE